MNNYAKNVPKKKNTPKKNGETVFPLLKGVLWLFIFLCFMLLVASPSRVSELIIKGGGTFFYSVLPSTFPYLVLSNLLVLTGFGGDPHKSNSAKRKHKIWDGMGIIVIISLITGFPVPAAMVEGLYEKNKCSKKAGEQICAFCSFCGPPFIISFFGAKVMGDIRAGIVCFLVQALLGLLSGYLLFKYERSEKQGNIKSFLGDSALNNTKKNEKSTDTPSMIICKSISSAGDSMLKIAGFVLFFSVFSGIINSILTKLLHTSSVFSSLVSGFLEISSGMASLDSPDFSIKEKFVLGAFYIYWSGLSVLFQVSSAGKSVFCLKKYLICRLFLILTGVPLAYFIYFFVVL